MIQSQKVPDIRRSHKVYRENQGKLDDGIDSRRKSLTEVKIQRGIFLSDALSPLIFVISMILLNHILRKCTGGYKLTKSQEKINHSMYMDDIKLFAKNEKGWETLIQAVRVYSQNIGRKITEKKSTENAP